MSKKVFISTPIYYPNDKLHIGHVYTTSIADAISRFHKLMNNNVFFVTGSDEHGQKILDKANEMGIETYAYVTKIIESFKKLWIELGIDNDLFIRTTDKNHEEFVRKIFDELKKSGYIYKGIYEGNYCKLCEEFFTDSQLATNQTCPNCGKKTKILKEDSYFLKVSKFQKWIRKELEENSILLPKYRSKELINNFIDNGLQDLSITRNSFKWGISVPGDDEHVIYVWFDALLNYLSALTYPSTKFSVNEIWEKDSNSIIIQLVGKEITRFHSIYWPIILKMLNYKTPKIYAHGWILMDGRKMSKSIGNIVDPFKLIKKYGSDSIRFFLSSSISFGDDGNISSTLIEEKINGILVNKYSNLLTRTYSMLEQKRNLIIPKLPEINFSETIDLIENLNKIKEEYINEFNNVEITKVTKIIVKSLDIVNIYIDKMMPWKKDGDEFDHIINNIFTAILKINILISPFLVNSSRKIFESILNKKIVTFDDWNVNLDELEIKKIDMLFKRIT